jgi:hypothetical protein
VPPKAKKADVGERLRKTFPYIGSLSDKPPGRAGLPFI